MSVAPAAARRIPASRLRTAIAKVTTASAAVPQFTVEYDVDVAAMLAERPLLPNPASHADVIHAAVARALRAHPRLNASWDGDAVIEHADINVGFAVALDDGLVVPAICHADRMSLVQLGEARVRLTGAARSATFTPAELLSATFTVSNLGPYGASRFRAIVLPPQAAILAVGGFRRGGEMTLALSCDHRVIDGARAAAFLREVADCLARPKTLLEPAPGDSDD